MVKISAFRKMNWISGRVLPDEYPEIVIRNVSPGFQDSCYYHADGTEIKDQAGIPVRFRLFKSVKKKNDHVDNILRYL